MGLTLSTLRPLARLASLALPAALVLTTLARAQATPPGIDLALAKQYFAEARERCAADNGRLWGLELAGPILIVDAASGTLAANQPDPAREFLQEREGVFVGKLPDTLQSANTAVDWAGARWAMVQWPLPDDPAERCRFLMHEVFHRVQDELRLPARDAVCGYLDTRDGRYWLQLEWRALVAALRQARVVDEARAGEQAAPGDPRNAHAQPAAAARNAAIKDALLFRRARRAMIEGAAEREHALEMNEGLAEYTGMALRGTAVTDTLSLLADRIVSRAETLPSYARSWAYLSGPAWGLLLDQVSGRDEGPQAWRGGLAYQDDLAELAGAAVHAEPPPDTNDVAGVRALLAAAEKAAHGYDGTALREAEVARDAVHKAELDHWRALLVDGPLLELPLTGAMNYTFDPNSVLALEGAGTVYPTFTLTDAWGSLRAQSGALLSADRGRAFVASPGAVDASRSSDSMTDELHGPGWTIKLAAGWHVVLGTRRGDYLVRSVLADASR